MNDGVNAMVDWKAEYKAKEGFKRLIRVSFIGKCFRKGVYRVSRETAKGM